MIVYNVTMKVHWAIAEDWLTWMQDICIPQILGTGYFIKHQFVRLIDVDETDGPTYAIQYTIASLQLYNEYVQKYATDFNNELMKHWGDKCLTFSTLMDVIS